MELISCFNLSYITVLYRERLGRECYETIEKLSKFSNWNQIKWTTRYKLHIHNSIVEMVGVKLDKYL